MLSKHNLEDYTFRRGLSVLKGTMFGMQRNLKLVCLAFYVKHVMCDTSFQSFSVWCCEVLAAFW